MCVTSYLSLAPDSLSAAVITGGLPALEAGIDQVYEATFARTVGANHQYYERYPEDRARVLALHEQLGAQDVRLPSGDRLTPRRLRHLGNVLGMTGGADRLHHLLELPVGSPAYGILSGWIASGMPAPRDSDARTQVDASRNATRNASHPCPVIFR